MPTPADILRFWFEEAGPERWFVKDETFDRRCAEVMGAAHDAAARGALDGWTATADGALALILLLDQAPRNLFRGTARAFATDAKARQVAATGIANGFDVGVDADRAAFFYLPFEHSEEMADQERALALFARIAEVRPTYMSYAERHADAIRRFGRFPHRNAILGRTSTPEEDAWMAETGGF